MSAELLREAAALMRERAEVATPGPWGLIGRGEYLAPIGITVAPDDGGVTGGDAEHIASWHPTVALAVADWLDAYAERLDVLGHGIGSNMGHALTVARAYLGLPDG